jgi:hypothetical protein
MPRWIDPVNWKGIEGAFNEFPVKWENYPDELPLDPLRAPIPGIHRPDRWGHWRKGHRFGAYNAAWEKVDKLYDLEAIERLRCMWGADDYKEARTMNFIQRINYAVFLHNHESLMRAVDDLCDAVAVAAVEDYKSSQLTPLQRRRRHKKPSEPPLTPLSLSNMNVAFWEK